MSHPNIGAFVSEWQYRPYRNSLVGPEALAYDLVLKGLLGYERTITLPDGLSQAFVSDLRQQMDCEIPELLFAKGGSIALRNNRPVSYSPEYRFPPEIAARMLRAMSERTSGIVRHARALDPERRIQALHDWLVGRFEYRDSGEPYSHSPAGAILFRRSVCEGVSKAMKYLCDRVRVPCVVAVGKAGNDPVADGFKDWGMHAWNIVDFSAGNAAEPRWHHVDATWDQCENSGVSCYACFGLSDMEASVDREIGREGYYPRCPKSLDFYEGTSAMARNAKDVENIILRSALRGESCTSFKTRTVNDRRATPERDEAARRLLEISQRALERHGVGWKTIGIASDFKHMVFTVSWS